MSIKKNAIESALNCDSTHIPTLCHLIAISGVEEASYGGGCEDSTTVWLAEKFIEHCQNNPKDVDEMVSFVCAVSVLFHAEDAYDKKKKRQCLKKQSLRQKG